MGDKERIRGSVDRRTVLAAAGIGAGVAAVGGIGCRGSDGEPNQTETGADVAVPEASEAVRALFGDLKAGAKLDNWKIRRVHGVYLGAIPVILETASGDAFQVDVMRRDPAGPQGVGNTETMSLYVSNTGDGSTKTDEQQGLGAMALAQALAQRESAGAAVPALMTLTERHEKYPKGIYSVPA